MHSSERYALRMRTQEFIMSVTIPEGPLTVEEQYELVLKIFAGHEHLGFLRQTMTQSLLRHDFKSTDFPNSLQEVFMIDPFQLLELAKSRTGFRNSFEQLTKAVLIVFEKLFQLKSHGHFHAFEALQNCLTHGHSLPGETIPIQHRAHFHFVMPHVEKMATLLKMLQWIEFQSAQKFLDLGTETLYEFCSTTPELIKQELPFLFDNIRETAIKGEFKENVWNYISQLLNPLNLRAKVNPENNMYSVICRNALSTTDMMLTLGIRIQECNLAWAWTKSQAELWQELTKQGLQRKDQAEWSIWNFETPYYHLEQLRNLYQCDPGTNNELLFILVPEDEIEIFSTIPGVVSNNQHCGYYIWFGRHRSLLDTEDPNSYKNGFFELLPRRLFGNEIEQVKALPLVVRENFLSKLIAQEQAMHNQDG